MKFQIILAAAGLAFASPVVAAQIKDAKCKDYTQVKDQFQPQYLAVVDGYNKAGKKVAETVDVGGIMTEADSVKQACAGKSSTALATVRKDLDRNSKSSTSPKVAATSINPMKAKCEDFIALGEAYRPVAIAWVQGNSKSGKVKNGEVDEEILEQPVATLVEECQKNPKASFYERAKTWLSAKL